VAIAESLERRGALLQSSGPQAPDFFDQTPLEHPFDPFVDARTERGPVPAQADEDGRPALEIAHRPAEMLGQGNARHRPHFERSDDADSVAGPDFGGGCGIEGFQPQTEGVPAVPAGFFFQSGPDGIVSSRPRKEAFKQGLDVQPGASDDDRQAAPPGNGNGGFGRPDGEICGGELGPAVDDVQEMMGDAGPFLGAGLVRSDIESR